MGRTPGCMVEGLRKGFWTEKEDQKLISYIKQHGEKDWRSLPKKSGLRRCGKSCRLRWVNYLRPGIKSGEFTPQEEQTIIRLHAAIGNKWSTIARELCGRTDNEIKNYWKTRLRRRLDKKDAHALESSTKEQDSISTSSSLSTSTSLNSSNFGAGNCSINKETPQPEIGLEVSNIRPVSSSAKLLNKLATKIALINLPHLISHTGSRGSTATREFINTIICCGNMEARATSNPIIGLENAPILTVCGDDQMCHQEMEFFPQEGFLEEIAKALENDDGDENVVGEVLKSISNGHFEDRLEFISKCWH